MSLQYYYIIVFTFSYNFLFVWDLFFEIFEYVQMSEKVFHFYSYSFTDTFSPEEW